MASQTQIDPETLARTKRDREQQGPPDLVLFVSPTATALYCAAAELIGNDYDTAVTAARLTQYLSKINDAVRDDGRIVPRIKGACPSNIWTTSDVALAFNELVRAGMARRGSDPGAMLIKLVPPSQHGKRALRIDADAPPQIVVAP